MTALMITYVWHLPSHGLFNSLSTGQYCFLKRRAKTYLFPLWVRLRQSIPVLDFGHSIRMCVALVEDLGLREEV